MTDRVTVTIGIPFFNAGPMLADAVRSVFAQTYDDWELILMDDGSTDSSRAIAEAIADPRVRCISDGVNRGLVHRLNQIAMLAQGHYLARMDADDLMHPRRLERQVQFLQANPHVAAVDTATYTVNHDLTPLGIRGDCMLETAPRAVLENGLFIHPTVMGQTNWFRAHPYSPAYIRSQDRELWCRTCTSSQFARLGEPLFFYREGLGGNLGNYLGSERAVREILRMYGPPLVGGRRTQWLVARSRLKSILYYVVTKIGLQGRLIRRRNRPLNAEERHRARGILAEIARTRVPGLCAQAIHGEMTA